MSRIFPSILLSLFFVAAIHAADFIWWEGEKPARTNFPKSSWFDPQNDQERSKLSGGAWMGNHDKRKPGSDEAFAIYQITVEKDGEYELWARKFWKHGPFRWRFDQQPWRECGRDVALADGVELRTHVGANWVYLGAVQLDKGNRAFELRLLAKEGEELTSAFDAFCLTRTAFFPSGKLKPGETTGLSEPGRFSVEPLPDAFDDDAILDLRYLNEKNAGENGWIKAPGDYFQLGNGKNVNFFAVNVSSGTAAQSRKSVDYLARKLAKLGVNMVRFHSPMWGDDLAKVDPEKLDNLQYLISAMKKQGIYTHLSFYFPLWVTAKKSDGFEGFDAIQNKHPFGLIYFDNHLQSLHRGWMTQILTSDNPYGPKLADEPALAIVELVNEDSLFFWTFSKQNIPNVYWERLETLYGQAILPAWDMTRQGIEKGGPAKLTRMQKQVRFLADIQRNFYNDARDFLRQKLKYKGLIVASNWQTADNATLLPIERWTYQACDIIDKHGYFGGEHQGEGSSYSVRVGHTYQDRSAMNEINKMPVHMIQQGGMPSMISEIGWPQPNQYRAEFVPAVSAFAGLQGIDNISLFAMGSNYVRDAEMEKFQLASPAIVATFPASALMYRRGDIQPATPVYITQSESDLFSLAKPTPTEAEALDALRKTGHERNTSASSAGLRMIRGQSPARMVTPARNDQITSKNGVMIIDTPRTKAAIGFLKNAGAVEIGGIKIKCQNDYAAIIVTTLDEAPIEKSNKVLVTRMTDDRPFGFDAPGGKIRSMGQFPFTVRNIEATIDLGWGAKPRSTQLDFNGMAIRSVDEAQAVFTVYER